MSVVLFAPDLRYGSSDVAASWVEYMCCSLQELGHEVILHPRERSDLALHASLESHGVRIAHGTASPSEDDESAHLPRFRSRAIIAAQSSLRADAVVSQGFELSRFLSGSRKLSGSLWCVLSDAPYRTDPLPPDLRRWLPGIVSGSRRLLVTSESERSWLETEFPAATSKVSLLPRPGGRSPGTDGASEPSGSISRLVIDLDMFREDAVPDLEEYIDLATQRHRVPTVHIVGGTMGASSSDSPWSRIPGAVIGALPPPGAPSFGLLPSSADPVAVDWAAHSHRAHGRNPIAVDPGSPDHEFHRCAGSGDLLHLLADGEAPTAPSVSEDDPLRRRLRVVPWFPSTHRPDRLWPGQDRPLRVVVAGGDFKFAGDLITALAEHPWIDLKIDVFEHNSRPQPEVSSAYVKWADVIIAEFASHNALWYARNVSPRQKLIVHLHGFELISPWIDDLEMEHVSALVVASQFYRQRALDLKGWDPHRVYAIANSVDSDDLLREKLPDARFHLGMAGYVPILKRPDRALDLLRLLRMQDDRFTLHLRGNAPWNYVWEWKKSAHQDAYRQFYSRIAQDELLRHGVSFEPFGPDMGTWLRRIGWMLSPSTRETFHLAGIEGAASGAVPVAWDRDGAREIFSDRWTITDVDEAAGRVLDLSRDTGAWAGESLRAIDWARRFDARTTSRDWFDLLARVAQELPAASSSIAGTGSPVQDRVLRSVASAVASGGTEAALEVLDAAIPVTANATGPLKAIEMRVRGIAALDAHRSALLGPDIPPAWATDGPGASVRLEGSDSLLLGRHGLDPHPLDVAPPEAFGQGVVASRDFQIDRGASHLAVPGMIRADRWIMTASHRIRDHLDESGSAWTTVSGPWWLALATVIAADHLGIPCAWEPRSEDIAKIDRAAREPYGADPEDHLAHLAATRSHGLLVDHCMRPNARTQGVRFLDPADLQPGGRGAAPRTPGIPQRRLARVLQRDPSSVRVLSLGPGRPLPCLESAGVRRENVAWLEEARRSLSPEVDVLLVDGMIGMDPAWSSARLPDRKDGSSPVGRLLDRARALGITTIVTIPSGEPMPKDLLVVARRADHLIAKAEDADHVLKLHPTAVQSILPEPRSREKDAGLLLLRGARISVPAPVDPGNLEGPPPAPSWTGDPPREEGASGGELPSERGPELEGVSVIIATSGGRERIGRTLRSLLDQSLPDHLVEIIVVENGPRDGTEDLVREFDREPGSTILFVHEKVQGAGRARTVGLHRASRDFVTFVDDDDILERDHLLSLWSAASAEDVVLGRMADVQPDGSVRRDTPAAAVLEGMGSRPRPAHAVLSALGFNACKLLPIDLARTLSYPEDVHSGEDVVYMAGILTTPARIVPAAPMPKSSYLRTVRPGSLSRRTQEYAFGVTDRLGVIAHLETRRADIPDVAGARALDQLQRSQSAMMHAYLSAHPEELRRAREEAGERGLLGHPCVRTVL